MKDGYRILGSAYKHGITEQEIHHVLSEKNPTRRCYEMHDDENGNAQDMYVATQGLVRGLSRSGSHTARMQT